MGLIFILLIALDVRKLLLSEPREYFGVSLCNSVLWCCEYIFHRGHSSTYKMKKVILFSRSRSEIIRVSKGQVTQFIYSIQINNRRMVNSIAIMGLCQSYEYKHVTDCEVLHRL